MAGERLWGWLKHDRFRMAIALCFTLLLPAPSRAVAQAVPLDAQPTLVQRGILHNRLLSIATPELPPLDQSDRFLPVPDPFADVYLVIKLSSRRVYVYNQHQVKDSYPVAIGRSGWETPTGQFKVLQMLRNPVWQNPFTGELIPPGSDNPLGSRWIAFWTDGKNFIGFHGTPNVDTVGRPASHGCVRMYDRDVVKLFEMVKVGTPVIVTP